MTSSMSEPEERPACVLPHPEPEDAAIGYLCRRHYNRIGQVLTQITELSALQPYLNPRSGESKMGGPTIHSPAPGNLHTAALTDRRARNDGDDIPNPGEALYGWCRMVEEENQAPLRSGTIAGMCNYLHAHRHWIAQQSWCDDYAQDLDHLHRALAQGAGDTMWPKPVAACMTPGCGGEKPTPLYNTIGVDSLSCPRCKRTYSGLDLVRLHVANDTSQREAK